MSLFSKIGKGLRKLTLKKALPIVGAAAALAIPGVGGLVAGAVGGLGHAAVAGAGAARRIASTAVNTIDTIADARSLVQDDAAAVRNKLAERFPGAAFLDSLGGGSPAAAGPSFASGVPPIVWIAGAALLLILVLRRK